MATLLAIRTQTRIAISQAAGSGDFADSEIDGFINEGVRFLAPLIKWPRDRVEIQVELDVPAYTLPADNILLLDVYFGDTSIRSDRKPLRILPEEALKEIRPNWEDTTIGSQGRPDTAILLDRQTILINPRPNADESAAGKKLEIVYIYYPATLSGDGDTPDMPIVYHDLLYIYATSRCYKSRLNNPTLGDSLLNEVISKSKLLEPIITKEMEHQAMTWGSSDSLDTDGYDIITFG